MRYTDFVRFLAAELKVGMSSESRVTHLLTAWSEGDHSALDELMPLVYDELRQRAKYHLRGQRPGHTLQTTALVHETYLKLAGNPQKHWRNHAHFLGVAAQAMRHILVDYARSRRCGKRGGEWQIVSLEKCAAAQLERGAELVAIDEALTRLAEFDARKSRVIELRYFGGLSVEETAEVLKVSPDTVLRDWRLGRTWLRRELTGRESNDG